MISRDEALSIVTAEGRPWEVQDVVVKGRPRKWFVNGPQSLRALFEQNLSDSEFLIYQDERHTFREAYDLASNIAHHLKHDFGVQPGDRIAIALRNYPEWSLAFTAITSLGAIAVAINAWWEADEINYALEHTGVSLIFADDERIERVQRIAPAVSQPIISVNDLASQTQVSFTSANQLMRRFIKYGILTEMTGHTRNRQFRYSPYIDLFANR